MTPSHFPSAIILLSFPRAIYLPFLLMYDNSSGGAFSSTNDLTTFLHTMFLSPTSASFLPSTTIKHWLRSLFTHPDFVTEVGLPWEIHLHTLETGRNTKIYSKGGGIGAFQTYITIDRNLGYSVHPDEIEYPRC